MEHTLIVTDFALLCVGILSGGLGALLGIGGGVIVIPFLVLVLDLPIRIAIGTSFIAVLATSLSSTSSYLQTGLCEIDTGVTLEAATVPGAALGAYMAGIINQKGLQFAFSLILFYVSLSMLLKGGNISQNPEKSGGESPRKTGIACAASFFAGIISGSLGVGGGIVKVPVLYRIIGFPLKKAIATSSYMIGITVATGALVFALRGDMDPFAAALLVAGIFLGSKVGTKMLPVIPEKALRFTFALLLFYFGVKFIVLGIT